MSILLHLTKENVKDGQTLKKYLKSNYNMTVDQATEKWKENLTDQIKTEFIFGLIAEKENIKMDDDAFNSYVDYIVSASNGQFSKSSEVYKYFGSGHKDEGKTYLKNQYLVNKAIDTVTEKANVTLRMAVQRRILQVAARMPNNNDKYAVCGDAQAA